jgi:hypothetical protein
LRDAIGLETCGAARTSIQSANFAVSEETTYLVETRRDALAGTLRIRDAGEERHDRKLKQ